MAGTSFLLFIIIVYSTNINQNVALTRVKIFNLRRNIYY
jgi:hypothetical protein